MDPRPSNGAVAVRPVRCLCSLQLLWNYKLNLTTDPKFESVAVEVCRTTISEVSPVTRLTAFD